MIKQVRCKTERKRDKIKNYNGTSASGQVLGDKGRKERKLKKSLESTRSECHTQMT